MIRRLQPWELEQAVPVARAFRDASGVGTRPFDEARFLAHLRALGDGLAVMVAEAGGSITGALAGIVTPHYMTGEPFASELFWFILPEHRGGADAVRMLAAFEDFAREKQATFMLMASFANDSQTAVETLYQRRGFTPVETHFIKPLSPPH